MFFVISRAWEKEKILSPHEESNLRLSDSVLGCPTTEPQRLRWAQNPKVWGSIPHGDSEVILFPSFVTRRKTSFSISLPSSKLTKSLILFTNITPSKLLILANVSNVYFALGQFEKGIDYLEKDLKTSIEFHDWEGEAMAYTSLSAACHILYQNEKAIEYCGKGLKIFRGKGIRQGEGRSCLNLLSYYLHLGDYATALKYSEEALKAIRSNQKKEISVLSQAKICNIFMQYERSIGRCKIALIIETAMADQQGKYQCYLAFGKTYNNLVCIEEQFTMRIEVSKRAKNWKSEIDLPRVSLVIHCTIKVSSKNQLNISQKLLVVLGEA